MKRPMPGTAISGYTRVHEVLKWVGEGVPGPTVTVEGMQLDHHPDPTKSRGQYLPLLELSVEEEPEDDRNTHYLGREYMYRGRWDDCIRTLEHHLSMPTATWKDERRPPCGISPCPGSERETGPEHGTGISVPLQRPPICGSRIWI